ncbi:kinase phosphorylation protein-domain-containing protein [Hygrophoropsis aurantiaca]|uniref:Kinase phosphorylation protein-domain-containing protein n=1 Tax=Hygrophoropsis aurantiaca TaxID=72124 RepID=A0ACB8AC83_9AGAM|nr:kinase phosphorylation protein-domain-containing protein [Hygrophoropsis aurantiaca]
MFEPIRGGTRGGQAEFKWTDVSADKDRENYLGHSINAPTGRWQKNKDVHWYNRDLKPGEAERLEEIRKIKEAETEALSAALGFDAAPKGAQITPSTSSTPAISSSAVDDSAAQRALEKEEKRRRKAERKEEKKARKEARRGERVASELDGPRRRDRSRSQSPRRRDDVEASEATHRRRYGRSPSPTARERRIPPKSTEDYDEEERARERERDRRRWDLNSRRERPTADYRRD